ALGTLDPQRGLAPTLQQIADAAKQLFAADGAGLMLVDAEGQLRWASASDQTTQTVEDGQERLAPGAGGAGGSRGRPRRRDTTEGRGRPGAAAPGAVCGAVQPAPPGRHP